VSNSQHIKQEIFEQALEWWILLKDGAMDANRLQQFELWKNSHPDHVLAWQRTLKLEQRLAEIQSEISKRTLAEAIKNRSTVWHGKLLLLLASSSLIAAMLYLEQQQAWLADHRTAYGEQKTIVLSDGTQLTLNSKTAIDVDYSDKQRQIVLHYGEIFIQTRQARSTVYRPFTVLGRDGTVQALGTQFDVAQEQQHTRVAVLQHAVNITNNHAKQQQRVNAGQQILFDQYNMQRIQPLQVEKFAWRKGLLIVNQLSLLDFAKKIEKNYGIHIEVEASAQSILISGSYPSNNLEHLLSALTHTYPITAKSNFWGNKYSLKTTNQP
jgi:transmembrane sensor